MSYSLSYHLLFTSIVQRNFHWAVSQKLIFHVADPNIDEFAVEFVYMSRTSCRKSHPAQHILLMVMQLIMLRQIQRQAMRNSIGFSPSSVVCSIYFSFHDRARGCSSFSSAATIQPLNCTLILDVHCWYPMYSLRLAPQWFTFTSIDRYVVVFYMLKVTYFQTSMDMVPHKCSTIVSLPVHIEGIQSFVEAPDKRTLAFHKFPLADFIDLCSGALRTGLIDLRYTGNTRK